MMRSSKTISLLLMTMTFGLTYGQDEEKPDFTYEVKKEIKHPGYFSFEVNPITIGFRNYFTTFGVGGGVRLSNLNNKFSAEARGEFNFANISINNNKIGYRSIDVENKKGFNLEGNIGYTVAQNKKNELQVVRLRKKGNTEFVSNMPCDVIKSYIIRAGFVSNGFFLNGEASSVDPSSSNGGFYFSSGDYYKIYQTVSSVSIGIVRKHSVNTFFKTDKFGTINESSDIEIYADILINVNNTFPQLNRLLYEDETYPNEISSEQIMSYQDQNYVRDQFFKLPAGIRVGTRNNSYKKAGFFWSGEIGVYPGSYSTYSSAIGVRLGLGFRFQNNF